MRTLCLEATSPAMTTEEPGCPPKTTHKLNRMTTPRRKSTLEESISTSGALLLVVALVYPPHTATTCHSVLLPAPDTKRYIPYPAFSLTSTASGSYKTPSEKEYFIFVQVVPLAVRNTSNEVHEAGLPHTCSRPCAFEVKKTQKKEIPQSHQTLPKHTTIYIRSSPATATTSRRRAAKHVPLGSPCSHSSSIDLGFVEIGLACIHTYVYTRTAAAAAADAPPVYVLVLYTIFWLAQLRLSLL